MIRHQQWVEDKDTKDLLKVVKRKVQTVLKPGQNPGASSKENIGNGLGEPSK